MALHPVLSHDIRYNNDPLTYCGMFFYIQYGTWILPPLKVHEFTKISNQLHHGSMVTDTGDTVAVRAPNG